MLHKDCKIFIDKKHASFKRPPKIKDIWETYKILREFSGQYIQTRSYLHSATGENIYDQSQWDASTIGSTTSRSYYTHTLPTKVTTRLLLLLTMLHLALTTLNLQQKKLKLQ